MSVPSRSHPSSAHPSSVHPSSAHPSSAHPSSAHPSSAHPSSAHPSQEWPAVAPSSATFPQTDSGEQWSGSSRNPQPLAIQSPKESTPTPVLPRTGAVALPKTLTCRFQDLRQLQAAYMPFLTRGGLFIPGEAAYRLGETVWVVLQYPEDWLAYLPAMPDVATTLARFPPGTPPGTPYMTDGVADGMAGSRIACLVDGAVQCRIPGEVAWITPRHTHPHRTAGVGIHFAGVFAVALRQGFERLLQGSTLVAGPCHTL
jgi:Tfp pilus assembly protein PilZ